jgi:hypothetical protein
MAQAMQDGEHLTKFDPFVLSFSVFAWGMGNGPRAGQIENEHEDERSELVRQHFFRFYSHVYSQCRGVCQALA